MDSDSTAYLQLIKEIMSARSSRSPSSSPARDKPAGASSSSSSSKKASPGPPNSSGASSAGKHKSAGKSSSSPSRLSSARKSAGSRASSAMSKDSGIAGGGKASSATSRRVTIKSADIMSRGLKTVDLSGQGMTTLPANIFHKKEVGILDLGSNNLRSIPADIRKLTHLVHLDLSRNGIRCSTPNDYVGVPKDLATLQHLEVLIISECNLPYVPPSIWQCKRLKVLDISRNKINVLLPEVGNLEQLQHLNAMQTSIATLPPEIAFCQDLEEVLLWGNVIESLPETMKELPRLKYLAINYRSFCSIVDNYMEGLLQTGQIQSEHIPPVLFEMPALDILDLEETKINSLPEQCIGKLKEFYLGRNYFQRMPPVVPTLDLLEILEISDNMISVIPSDIGNLASLQVFKMNNNSIVNLPPTIGRLTKLIEFCLAGNQLEMLPLEIGKMSNLRRLVLDSNKLEVLPDTIVDLQELQTLDVTHNRLTSLPMNFYKMKKLKAAHSYEKFQKYGLWLHLNPLSTPPPDIWKTDNPEKIYNYLKRLQIRKTENLQRQKLFVLGEAQCGKTSLIRSLTTGKSVLTNQVMDGTQMIDYLAWKTENNVSFLIHDLGGEDIYKLTHHLFLDAKGIYLIVYDHRKYTPQNHHAAIGYWLDLLLLYVPGAVVKVIGTQSDQCNEDFIDKITEHVEEQLKIQVESHFQKVETQLHQIECKMATSGLSEEETQQLDRQHLRLTLHREKPLKVELRTTLTSSAEGIRGIIDLTHEIELLAVNKKLFPHAQRFIPELWQKFRKSIKRCKKLCLSWVDIQGLAAKNSLPEENIPECLRYLCDIGEIVWFQKLPALDKLVFQKPRKLVEILQGLFRHDMYRYLSFDENRIFASKGQLSREMFDLSLENFNTQGQLSRPFLLCLWFYLTLDYDTLHFLLELIPNLNLCYIVPQPDLPPRRSEYVPLMVIPSFNRDPAPQDITDMWPAKPPAGIRELSCSLTFPLLYPEGLFEQLTCHIQNYVESRVDWRDLVYATFDSGTLLLRRDLDPESYDCVLRLTVRGVNVDTIGKLFSSLCGDLKSLLDCYVGLVWYVNQGSANSDEDAADQSETGPFRKEILSL